MDQTKRESKMWIYVNLIGTLIVGVILLLAIPAIADAAISTAAVGGSKTHHHRKIIRALVERSDETPGQFT